MISVAINGVGRIGKSILRILCSDAGIAQLIQVKAINIGPADPQALVYLLMYDSIYGAYQQSITYKDSTLHIGAHKIAVYTEMDARKLPWKSLGIDWVVDATGKYTKRDMAQHHLDAGARAVLISAPAHDEDITIIPGVNDQLSDKNKHKIVSLGSCTTNAVVPILHVLKSAFDVEYTMLNTVHAYTNTQALLDVNPNMKDPRRSRAAALNIVPTSTGALETVGKIFPDLQQRVAGGAFRVPVPVVSLADVTFTAKSNINVDQLIAVFEKAAAGSLKNILATSAAPLVSTDYLKNPHSVVIDLTLMAATGNLGRVFGWYDNEYGYSMRLRDFLMQVAR